MLVAGCLAGLRFGEDGTDHEGQGDAATDERACGDAGHGTGCGDHQVRWLVRVLLGITSAAADVVCRRLLVARCRVMLVER